MANCLYGASSSNFGRVPVGVTCEAEHCIGLLARVFAMYLTGLGMLWLVFVVFGILVTAVLFSPVGLLISGWVPVITVGESSDVCASLIRCFCTPL